MHAAVRVSRKDFINDAHQWRSGWLELDSHSDLIAEHTLGSIPTMVRLELARLDGKKVLRSREFSIDQFAAKVGYRTCGVTRTDQIAQMVELLTANRYQLWAYWDAAKPALGKVIDESRRRNGKTSDFLDALEDLDEHNA